MGLGSRSALVYVCLFRRPLSKFTLLYILVILVVIRTWSSNCVQSTETVDYLLPIPVCESLLSHGIIVKLLQWWCYLCLSPCGNCERCLEALYSVLIVKLRTPATCTIDCSMIFLGVLHGAFVSSAKRARFFKCAISFLQMLISMGTVRT